jgi:single-stranded-DNA-specific exonuclease
MRGLTHRWIEPGPAPDVPLGTGLERAVERVLAARGLASPEDAAAFIEPRLTSLSKPGALADLDRAAERLLHAARSGETLAIYGDYDVDGIAATAILYHALAAAAPDAARDGRIRTRVPHRLEEGYGLNPGALRELADAGASVVVTVDCGVTAHEEAALARALGLDLIVTDHHEPGADGLPPAWAVVHPMREANDASASGARDLCGAGVAFKIAWRVLTLAAGRERLDEAGRETLLDLLALAGLATVADVVPLVDENRTLARFGLARIRATRLVGLRALLEASGLGDQRIDSERAGFALGPRLNAVGRLGHAREAVELLTTADGARAAHIAGRLDRLNRARQKVERAILAEASEMAERAGMHEPGSWTVVLAGEGWHPGVVGIVCSRLVSRYGRPAVLLCREGETLRGSARSVDGFDLHGALSACAAELDRFGGHEMAAGLSLRADRLDAFRAALEAHAAGAMTEDSLVPSLRIDCEATLDELGPACVAQLDRLGPFGRRNPAPALLLRDARVEEGATTMGAHGRHMSLRVRQGGRVARAVAWGWGERAGLFPAGASVDLVVRPRINEWRGARRVEVETLDARVAPAPAVAAGALSRPTARS